MKLNELKIEVLQSRSLNKGPAVVIGVISIAELANRLEVPQRDFKAQKGYQREVSNSRVNQLVGDVRKNAVDLPTSVLLNLRVSDSNSVLKSENGKLFLVTDEIFYVVDGQHRLEGLIRLYGEDPAKWGTYTLSFVCLVGASELDEMWQFYVVNSRSKSVRTDLAYDLLNQQAKNNGNVMFDLIEKGQDWKVKGQQIAEKLSDYSPVWNGRVRFAGGDRGGAIVTSAGLVTSFKPLLKYPYFSKAAIEDQVKILDAYWQGIKLVFPEAFDMPMEYGIQKQTGAVVLHNVLINVIEILRSREISVLDPKNYADIMSCLNNLEGDIRDGGSAKGLDFWLAGSAGAAGTFTSGAGQRVLISKILDLLPTQVIR